MDAWITLIGSVGFPIVACLYMFKIYEKQGEVLSDLRVAITKLTERLDVDIDSLSDKKGDGKNG